MTTRPHPHLGVVGPNVYALRLAEPQRIGAPVRTLALVPSPPMERRGRWFAAVGGLVMGVALIAATLLRHDTPALAPSRTPVPATPAVAPVPAPAPASAVIRQPIPDPMPAPPVSPAARVVVL